METRIPSILRVLVVNSDTHPVPRGGILVVMRPGWVIPEMWRIHELLRGMVWGWMDDGDSWAPPTVPYTGTLLR